MADLLDQVHAQQAKPTSGDLLDQVHAQGGGAGGRALTPGMSDDDIIKAYGMDPALVKASPRYQDQVKKHGSGLSSFLTDPNDPQAHGIHDSWFSDMREGMQTPILGMFQLVRHGLNKIGVVSDADMAYSDLWGRMLHDDYLQNVRHGQASGAAQLAGNAMLPVPPVANVIKGSGMLPAIARGVVAGGTAAAMQPVDDTSNFGTEKLKQVGIGAGTGAVVSGVVSGGSRAVDKLRARIAASKGVQLPAEVAKDAEAATGAARTSADAANTQAEQTAAAANTTAESRATAQQLQAEQRATATKTNARTAATATAGDLRTRMERTPFADYSAVKEAAEKGDESAQQLLTKLENAGTDPGKVHEASIDLSDWRTGQEAKSLYDARDALTEKHRLGVVPLESTAPALQNATTQARFGVKNKPVLNVLKEVEDALTPKSATIPGTPASTLTDAAGLPLRAEVPAVQGKGWPTNTVALLRKLSDDLGERIRMNSTGDNALIGPAGIGQLQSVKSAIDRDVAQFIDKSGVPEVQEAARKADEYYAANRVPFKNRQIANAGSGTTDTDQIFNRLVQAGKGDQAQRFYDALDPKGRSAVQFSMVAKAMNDATDNLSGGFDHGKFFKSVDKLGDAYGVFFTGADKVRIQGLKHLMQQAAESDAGVDAVKSLTDANVKGTRAIASANVKATAEAGKAQVSSTAEAWKKKVADAQARTAAVSRHPLGTGAVASLGAAEAFRSMGMPAPAAVSGGVAGVLGLAKALVMTDAGKRFLLAAGMAKPGSPAMQKLLDEMGTKLAGAGARAATVPEGQ